jgi:hypothetical protein
MTDPHRNALGRTVIAMSEPARRTDMSALRLLEVGDKPFIKQAFPDQTIYFSTYFTHTTNEPDKGRYSVSPATLPILWRAMRDPALSLIVCHPTFFAPWDVRWLGRALFDRRSLRGHVPIARAFGPQLLRGSIAAPLAVLDHEDLPLINRNNFFLLDKCRAYFKRELPVDRWRLFLKTGHANLPTARFRRTPRNLERIAKVHPISLGLPSGSQDLFPAANVEKTADVFFAGNVRDSSSMRQAGLEELVGLRAQGVRIDVADTILPRAEFYRRCAGAWLTWSPEGYGWDCFRHYEALACGSVPIINYPTIERHRPLVAGEHVFFYGVEAGGLSDTIRSALRDKTRLARMAENGRAHVLAHHDPAALARHIVETALRLGDSNPPGHGTMPAPVD